MLVYGKCECFVMHMFVFCLHPVAVLNVGYVLHDLQASIHIAYKWWSCHRGSGRLM